MIYSHYLEYKFCIVIFQVCFFFLFKHISDENSLDFCFQETHTGYDLFSTQVSDSCIMVLFLHITTEMCRWLIRSKTHDRASFSCRFHKFITNGMVNFLVGFHIKRKSKHFLFKYVAEIIPALNGSHYFKYVLYINTPFAQLSFMECGNILYVLPNLGSWL